MPEVEGAGATSFAIGIEGLDPGEDHALLQRLGRETHELEGLDEIVTEPVVEAPDDGFLLLWGLVEEGLGDILPNHSPAVLQPMIEDEVQPVRDAVEHSEGKERKEIPQGVE